MLDGRTGYLVAPGDSQGMAARVLELLADRDRAARMGRAGRETVIAHWSVDRMVQGYQEMIEGIYAAKERPKAEARMTKEVRSPKPEGDKIAVRPG